MVAVDYGNSEIARLLCESGRCSLDDRLGTGADALSMARENGDDDMIKVLCEARDKMGVSYVPTCFGAQRASGLLRYLVPEGTGG